MPIELFQNGDILEQADHGLIQFVGNVILAHRLSPDETFGNTLTIIHHIVYAEKRVHQRKYVR